MELIMKGGWSLAALMLGLSTTVHAQTTVTYIHTDALGSVVATSDEAGNVTHTREYEPYGYQLGGPSEGVGYTGHVQDPSTGLVYMQQRYYDPMIGRFLSVDPVEALDDPVMMFGRYHYANNNPFKFIDPDGRRPGLMFRSGQSYMQTLMAQPNSQQALKDAGKDVAIGTAVVGVTAVGVGTGSAPMAGAGVALRHAAMRFAPAATRKATEFGKQMMTSVQQAVTTASTNPATLTVIANPQASADFVGGVAGGLSSPPSPPTSPADLAGQLVGGVVSTAVERIENTRFEETE